MKKIIALAGEIGCGKGTVAEYLIERYNAKKIRYSDMLRDVLDRYYVEHTREHMDAVSNFVRKQFGNDIMAKVMVKDVENSPADILVLDGVRRESDLDGLKDLPGFKFIYIDVSIENRFQRIKDRPENQQQQIADIEQYKKYLVQESDYEIPALKQIAGVVIENNGTLEELKQEIDELISNY